MGKADKERAERGELHRDGKKVTMTACPFPDCPNFKHPDSPYGACERHSDLINDVLYILDHTRLPGQKMTAAQSAKQAEGGILLPGMPGFDISMKRR